MSMQPKRSVRCDGFGHQAMPNLSCRCTVRYTIYFASGDICFVRTTIDYCELAHSRRGKRWLVLVCRVELSQLCKSPRPNFVNVTKPVRTLAKRQHRCEPDRPETLTSTMSGATTVERTVTPGMRCTSSRPPPIEQPDMAEGLHLSHCPRSATHFRASAERYRDGHPRRIVKDSLPDRAPLKESVHFPPLHGRSLHLT